MPDIRLMKTADADRVSELDALAFASYYRQKNFTSPIPHRSRQNILASLDLNPEGCFVAVIDEPVGYIFSRRLGKVGWIGTFGVHPDYKGQDIGRSLLDAAVEHLRGAGCTTIGLETMADSPYNIGFYSRYGFLPQYPTFLLEKETNSIGSSPPYTVLSESANADNLPIISRISQIAYPGLDYSAEVYNARQHGYGETLLIERQESFALIRTISKIEGVKLEGADVLAFVLPSKSEQAMAGALHAVEDYAFTKGFNQLHISINTIDYAALRIAYQYGFRLSRIVIRMILERDSPLQAGRVLNKWLM
jgi:ribosomal protein S18 acetylase RimI-like enzyme